MEYSWKALLFKRILPSLLCFGAGFFGLMLARGGESQLGVLAGVLFAFPFLIIGAIFIANPIANFLAAPFVNLLYPADHSYSPPPLYRLPEMYVRQGRHEEAAREYQKILHHHPRELRAYLALLEVAFLHLGDPTLAAKVHHNGLRRLKDPADRSQLDETYQALLAGAPLASSSIESYP